MVAGEPLTPHEEAVWRAGQDAVRNTVPALNDLLGRLVTLDAALLGGGLVVARGDVLPLWAAVPVLAALLASLFAALAGLWPRRALLDLGDLDRLRQFEADAVTRKADALTVAGLALAGAAAAAVAGVVGRLAAVG